MKTLLSKHHRAVIQSAERRINGWLAAFGLSATAATADDGELPDGECGEYEGGSVFTKTIAVCVCVPAVRRYCKELVEPYSRKLLDDGIRTTIYHEVGHALVEQIDDWLRHLPEARALREGDLGGRFEEVFDDGLDEETLVEDFAQAFLKGRPSPLSLCFAEMDAALSA